MSRQQYNLDDLTPQELTELRAFSTSPSAAHTDERRYKERRRGKAAYGRQLRNTGRTLKVAFKMRPDVKGTLTGAARAANVSETTGFERAVIDWARKGGIDVAD